jgi:putative nucleotidyltransferase with HDIG domain
MEITRDEAHQLLLEYTKSESLIKHALSVEAAMKAYAEKFGEDENKWGITGLIHDFDYEKYPSAADHPFKGAEILKKLNYPQDLIDAILGHANYTGVKRETLLSKTLFAVDELSGFLFACTYVTPEKKIGSVKVSSVKKKLKDKAFARSVNRDDIFEGVKELNVDLDEHIDFLIKALSKISDTLGL